MAGSVPVFYIITTSAVSHHTRLHVNVRQFQVERSQNEIQCSTTSQQSCGCAVCACVLTHVRLPCLSYFTKLQTESKDSLGKKSNIDL